MRLFWVRLIGAVGLVLDVAFHWMEERNLWEFLVDDFFEAENEARWETFPLGGDLFIRGLSITAHVMLLIALLALILAPHAIRELRIPPSRGGVRMGPRIRIYGNVLGNAIQWAGLPLRFWRWLGGIGLVVDFVFHWLEQGVASDFLLDDFFEGSAFFRGMSLAAHLAFITALVILVFAPRLIKELKVSHARRS